jgi:hypothetical protein
VAGLYAVVITEFHRNLSKWEYKQCCPTKFVYISNELCFYGIMASIAKHAVAFNNSKIQVTTGTDIYRYRVSDMHLNSKVVNEIMKFWEFNSQHERT